MTNDSRLFSPRPRWEAKGYRPDEYSRWLLGDWRPIEELWEEMDIDPSRPVPAEIELEEWLFDTTAGPERRDAAARFVHGHWLKPGDVTCTEWRARCAQPPYDGLPIPRAWIPAGVVLSREGDAWIRAPDADRATWRCRSYQGAIMIQPVRLPSARRAGCSGNRTPQARHGRDCQRWNRKLRSNPQFLLMRDSTEDYGRRSRNPSMRSKSRFDEVASVHGRRAP